MDTADGTIDMWLYNESGVQKGHWYRTGEVRMAKFDHYINKVTLGGNRTQDNVPDETRAYIDDFIIDGARIGPTYFSLLKDQQ